MVPETRAYGARSLKVIFEKFSYSKHKISHFQHFFIYQVSASSKIEYTHSLGQTPAGTQC
jgi:hypothetical protein